MVVKISPSQAGNSLVHGKSPIEPRDIRRIYFTFLLVLCPFYWDCFSH